MSNPNSDSSSPPSTNTNPASSDHSKCPFGSPNRYTTTHDTTTHNAIFFPSDSTTLPSPIPSYTAGGMVVHDAWSTTTTTHPSSRLSFTSDADISSSPHLLPPPPTRSIWFPSPGETLLRYCDWPPGATLPLHRTETLDLGVCVAGSMELTLDSGQTRTLRVGDVVVQRGTMHAWRNASGTEWARVVFFLAGAEAVDVGGGGVVMREVLPWAASGGGGGSESDIVKE
ncbi:uncharacterized protein B0T15DRAFT_388820 [Chaetomium strumarium]|uniref:Cupin type-2 domain-containing protein n=1 Tax=Chaetomium strumarium TaxID=1170767 RepID=A0AAJ0H4K8_9PEZI|nr:hypothetical protein B0T15DRAFT_388820 [Chaetomium strumarium]